MSIVQSTEKYEAWLRAQLKGDIEEDDLAEKHQKMAADAFQFLRATYWRWAETIFAVCPGLKRAPQALAVGDIHVENFGSWRDGEGRLVWGVNDFDEAARMPYAIDIVRLATSAVLAHVPGITPQTICGCILAGYREGIGDPRPFVLDRDNKALRKVAVVSERERKDFWKKFDPAQIALKTEKNKDKGERPKVRPARSMRPRYRKALERGKPDASVTLDFFERTAGTGSLGRRRYVAVGTWQGDLIVREAKAIVPSGWALAHRGSRRLRCEEIATGKFRCPDPFYGLRGRVLLRRLSPNDFKIETQVKNKKQKDKAEESHKLVTRRAVVNAAMLHAMGRDLAAIHRGTHDRRKAIVADLERRGGDWLHKAMKAAKRKVESEFKAWSAHCKRAAKTK